MVSQSFIRREIAELEAQGFEVDRYSARSWDQDVVDPKDIAERDKTTILQDAGLVGILKAVTICFARPKSFLKAKRLALRMAKSSDRSVFVHIAYLVQACILFRLFAKRPVEHVHVHFATNATDIALLCHELGGPSFSFMVHGPEELDRAVVLNMDEKVSRAAFVTVITEFCRSQIYRWCSHDNWSKIQIVRCGLDADYLDREALPLSANRKFLNIGRICEQKGQLLLIEAAAVLAKAGHKFELTIIGDGPMRPELERMIASKKLSEHVHLAGWQTSEQVRQHLLESQTLVLPSFAEGLPVVILEALALQRPVITTYIAGIPELVDEACGWLVPAGSVEDLASAIGEALELDASSLVELGKVGAQRVKHQHDVRKEAALLGKLLKATST